MKKKTKNICTRCLLYYLLAGLPAAIGLHFVFLHLHSSETRDLQVDTAREA